MITLIINRIEKRLIYSISIGVLKAKGNYILFLQSTYILFKENILYELNYKIINISFFNKENKVKNLFQNLFPIINNILMIKLI